MATGVQRKQLKMNNAEREVAERLSSLTSPLVSSSKVLFDNYTGKKRELMNKKRPEHNEKSKSSILLLSSQVAKWILNPRSNK